MPDSLLTLLSSREQAAVEIGSPAPVCLIADLSLRDAKTVETCVCNTNVLHISKHRKEGNHFCGYRNIQMQALYVIRTFTSVPETLTMAPSILDIQNEIEQAWSHGINSNGRLQTGGIKKSRKHVGTQEVSSTLATIWI